MSLTELKNQGADGDAGSTEQGGLQLCKALMQELLVARSKKDLAPKTHALQHPAFKGPAPRVDPGVRVFHGFTASDKSDTTKAPKQLLVGHGATNRGHV